jgi:hypothetical protein
MRLFDLHSSSDILYKYLIKEVLNEYEQADNHNHRDGVFSN